jgi:hypothetical protein
MINGENDQSPLVPGFVVVVAWPMQFCCPSTHCWFSETETEDSIKARILDAILATRETVDTFGASMPLHYDNGCQFPPRDLKNFVPNTLIDELENE